MGQRPNDLTPHASPQHYLGAEMRAWRTQRGLSLGKLSRSILFNTSYMARVERGGQAASADLVRAYDDALGAGGSLVRLHASVLEGISLEASPRGMWLIEGPMWPTALWPWLRNRRLRHRRRRGCPSPFVPMTEGSSSCHCPEGL